MLIPLDTIKMHLRLDCEPSSELDPELERMYNAALDYVQNFTGRCMDELLVSESEPFLRPVFVASILLIIGDLFANREAVGNPSHASNTTVERLLHFHRKGLGV